MAFVLTWAADAGMLAAAAAVILPTRCLPRWLGWWAALTAPLLLAGIPLAMTGPPFFLLALIWILAAGIAMTRRGPQPTPPNTAHAQEASPLRLASSAFVRAPTPGSRGPSRGDLGCPVRSPEGALMAQGARRSRTALAYAGSPVFSSYVAVRDNVPGEPFGITAPFSVRTALVVGWGAGIAPPWFMPLTALLTAHWAKGPAGRARLLSPPPIGLASIVGHLMEPVTHRPGSWTPDTAASITLTLTASTSLAIAGYARYITNKTTAATNYRAANRTHREPNPPRTEPTAHGS